MLNSLVFLGDSTLDRPSVSSQPEEFKQDVRLGAAFLRLVLLTLLNSFLPGFLDGFEHFGLVETLLLFESLLLDLVIRLDEKLEFVVDLLKLLVDGESNRLVLEFLALVCIDQSGGELFFLAQALDLVLGALDVFLGRVSASAGSYEGGWGKVSNYIPTSWPAV